MDSADNTLSRAITWIAGVVALTIAISLPLAYFTLSYRHELEILDTEGEINARIASQVINANPDLWRFQQPKLEEFLSRRPRHGRAETRRIVDNDGKLIAESADPLDPPLISGQVELRDSGVRVGWIEVHRSLWPVLFRTGLVALFGVFLGLTTFVALRVLPLRALRRALAETKTAQEELANKAKELERSNTELQHFAYVASHDLQEPLRMVTSYVQLLARHYKGKLDQDAEEFIAFAVDGANRMRSLINALLAYSRIGTKGKEFEPTNCEAVLESALKNLEVAIEESGAAIAHDPLPTVMADAIQLTQLFQNLVGNALKFRADEAPRIHISSARNGKGWIFSVRDNGIGIDPQYAERIFVIFQRLHSREEYPGTGIGLVLCKKIVERHGGRIWVESRPGEGATFSFTIPAEG